MIETERQQDQESTPPDRDGEPDGTRRGAGRRRRPVRRLLGVTLALMLGWAVGLVWFAHAAAQHAGDDGRRTDAIVVLTGGSERLALGLALLADGRAERLFVSGVHRATSIADLLVRAPSAADLASSVDLGHAAGDTSGNARETAAWMHRRGFRSLRLVTSNYHMARSLLEFRAALPEAEVVPEPVDPDSVHIERWWQWPGTARLMVEEYNKYLVVLARTAVAAI